MTEVKQPASALSSPRFCNMGTFMRMTKLDSAKGLDFAIAGAPFDTASSFRSGSRFGPNAIRNISAMMKPNNAILQVNIMDSLKGGDHSITLAKLRAVAKKRKSEIVFSILYDALVDIFGNLAYWLLVIVIGLNLYARLFSFQKRQRLCWPQSLQLNSGKSLCASWRGQLSPCCLQRRLCICCFRNE